MTNKDMKLVLKQMRDVPRDKLDATASLLIAIISEADHTRRTFWWCTAVALCFVMLRDILGGLT